MKDRTLDRHTDGKTNEFMMPIANNGWIDRWTDRPMNRQKVGLMKKCLTMVGMRDGWADRQVDKCIVRHDRQTCRLKIETERQADR